MRTPVERYIMQINPAEIEIILKETSESLRDAQKVGEC